MFTGLPSRQAFLNGLQNISIADLPDSTTSDPACGICLSDLADNANQGDAGEGERAVRLHGAHFNGEQCIRRWLEENDSCPHCRERVHRGDDYDLEQLASLSREEQRRYVSELEAAAIHMIDRTRSIESPVVDMELLHLFIRLTEAMLVVDSPDDRVCMTKASISLMAWRTIWWTINPAYVTVPEYAPHERAVVLRSENLDLHFMNRVDQMLHTVTIALKKGAKLGRYVYMAHAGFDVPSGRPWFVDMYDTTVVPLRSDDEYIMTGWAMVVKLREATTLYGHLSVYEHRQSLLLGFQKFCEDVLVYVAQGLIEQRSSRFFAADNDQ
jgi:hypothetical protein